VSGQARLRFIAFGTVVGFLEVVNVVFAISQFRSSLWQGADWQIFWRATHAVAAGADPYAITSGGVSEFRWSPLAAWLGLPFMTLGLLAWRLLHVAALGLLRDRRMILLVGTSFPFWYDVRLGNLLTYAFVLAYLALRGSRWAAIGYLGLFLLVPRPLMAPVAAYLVWRRGWWGPFALVAFAEGAAVAAIGLGPGWLAALSGSTGDVANPMNLSPSRFVGEAWLSIGLPLAALLFWRGRLGLASIAMSPYLFAYYLLFAFIELAKAPAPSQWARLPLRLRWPALVTGPSRRWRLPRSKRPVSWPGPGSALPRLGDAD
jgi:hypothetical protein